MVREIMVVKRKEDLAIYTPPTLRGFEISDLVWLVQYLARRLPKNALIYVGTSTCMVKPENVLAIFKVRKGRIEIDVDKVVKIIDIFWCEK